MSVRAANRQKFIDALVSTGKDTVTLDEIKEVASNVGVAHPYWFTNDADNKLRRGVYRVPGASAVAQPAVAAETINMQAQVIECLKIVLPRSLLTLKLRILFLKFTKIMYRSVILMTLLRLSNLNNFILSSLLVILVTAKQCPLNKLVPNSSVSLFVFQ